MAKTIRMGVREFALPVPRTGHIETHSGYGPLPNKGGELHTYLQEKRRKDNPDYSCEAMYSHTFEHQGYAIAVSGRLDGLEPGPPPLLEEIKSAFEPRALTEKLRAGKPHPYLLQLKVYGYLHYLKRGEVPRLRMVIVSSRNREETWVDVAWDEDEFEAWLSARLDEVVAQEKKRENRARRRGRCGSQLTFPFAAMRPGQESLVQTVETGLTESPHQMIQAPTGLGKTVGILYPTLRHAFARGAPVFYVTPKNSQHDVARNAVHQMQVPRRPIKCLTLTARSKICMKPEPVCRPDRCEFARDYYDKVDAHGLLDKLASSRDVTRNTLQKMAERYEVCPYQLALDARDRFDIVVGDYHYAIAPGGVLTDTETVAKRRPALVIDEAHNLPSRAADLFSAELSEAELLHHEERLDTLAADWVTAAKPLWRECRELLQRWGPSPGESETRPDLPAEEFQKVSEKVQRLLSRYLDSGVELGEHDPILWLASRWDGFVERLVARDHRFFVTGSRGKVGVTLKITCCDASVELKEAYRSYANVVAFSATLKPFAFFAKLSGFDPETVNTAEFSSPFPPHQRKVMIVPQVSTKWRDRASESHRIAEAIERILGERPGNYFAFFPSFGFLGQTAQHLGLGGFRVLEQKPSMSQAEIMSVYEALQDGQPTVILAVQGGVFSEGMDYPGDTLVGAIVVGPALPAFNLERELLREYYDRHYGDGFDYAYVYPAMAKSIQAAGRVIRSPEDRGLIVFMDRRFLQSEYARTMPSDWFTESPRELVSSRILADVRAFWNDG